MSAQAVVVWWRDIPAQVIVRSGRRSSKRELPNRFIEAIDRAAMRDGAHASGAYLEAWRRGAPEPCGDDLEAEADRIVRRLDEDYAPEVLRHLAETGGRRG